MPRKDDRRYQRSSSNHSIYDRFKSAVDAKLSERLVSTGTSISREADVDGPRGSFLLGSQINSDAPAFPTIFPFKDPDSVLHSGLELRASGVPRRLCSCGIFIEGSNFGEVGGGQCKEAIEERFSAGVTAQLLDMCRINDVRFVENCAAG